MKHSILYLGILTLLAAPAAVGQSPAQRELSVVVVDAHADPSQPVQGVRVSLSFVAASEKVVDARDATNRSGQALLLVSPEAAQRDDLRLEIGGVSDLVIFQPADGQLSGLPANITVRLLPKGSVLLLGPPQIEAMLQRMSIQTRAKNQEIHALKAELAAAQSQKPDDLTAAMADWAKANGFEAADVDKQVQQWAEDIQKRKDQATANEKALAELALKHYGVAAQLFDQAADDIGQSMDEEEKKFLEQRRKQLRELVDKKFQSANTYQLNLQFHQATLILTQACDRAAAEHNHYPEDAALREIWLDAVTRLANARRDEGDLGDAASSAALLAQSIKDFQGLLLERSQAKEPRDWAKTQTNLGIALEEQGLRSGGAQATDLLAKAVEAYQAALGVYTRPDQPKKWAWTQNNLGNALEEQAYRSRGAQTAELLAQAVQAYRAALEVRTRAEMPLEWASTENNLGQTLMAEGERNTGTQATDLLAQAVAAFRTALEVRTKADDALEWAHTEDNLGAALWHQGEWSGGPEAEDLLAKATDAFRAALEVETKQSLPQDWAETENNLGVAFADEAVRANGSQAADLMAKAAEAFQASLEVRTRENLPQAWAHTEDNLAAALRSQAEKSGGEKAMDLLARAVAAYRAVLEVYTKADLPQDWATTQQNLAVALYTQGQKSSKAQALDSAAQSVQASRSALEVFTRTEQPQEWAMVQNNLALALCLEGERSSGKQAKDLFAQAVDAYRAALQVYTRTEKPLAWAMTQNNLGNALVDEGDYAGAAKALEECLEDFPDHAGILNTAISIYHDNLYRYDRAYELAQHWMKVDASPDAKISMLEQDLTTSRFEDCGKQAASIGDDAFPDVPVPMTLIRDSMRMACQWGAGQKADAQQTANALLLKSAQLQDVGFQFPGTRHFLGSSPAFDAGRPSWVALFDSLEKGDGAAMAVDLKQLQEAMKH